jgi:signal transduction histidine kinase
MIKSKAMENRIYEEINSLAHDLKTPLVTIRGLNSLFALSKNIDKLSEYSERIDGAVEKMSEMISSFLYGSSRQKIKPSDLVRYIQAQIPIEDDKLNVEIKIGDNLPDIYVNKIRVVRALINLVENAILVPSLNEYKLISIEAKKSDGDLSIIVSDNGVGIDPSIMDDIWKIGHSTNNTTGLGLPFAKKIVKENSGSIRIESELSVGTNVIVTFPFIDDDSIGEDI